MPIDWTPEQRQILDHPIDKNGRILAGPGTGKSTTVLTLATRLREAHGADAIRVTTFTRAATKELALGAAAGGHNLEPTTLHSFALSFLMINGRYGDLPKPVRIPDRWESQELIQANIALRLRAKGYAEARRPLVAKLERELAARWESLDPELVLLTDAEPELRNTYLSLWHQHRATFGYSLFAEMPLKAAEILEDHPDVDVRGLELLVVDEYQDLNRCEIGLLQALAQHDIRVLAVGDDDQSIYSFRMADPSGIRTFSDSFEEPAEYSLSVSQRCGADILNPAQDLIEMAPGRPTKPRLQPKAGNSPGEFAYLSFANEAAERIGVANLVRALSDIHGVPYSEIVIMVRGDYNEAWSAPLRDAMAAEGIPAVDIEEVLEPLRTPSARKAIALGRLAQNNADDLAWWGLLKTTRGISDAFLTLVGDSAMQRRVRFSERLASLSHDPIDGASTSSQNKALDLIRRVSAFLDGLELESVAASADGWATWLLEAAASFGVELETSLVDVLCEVGRVTPQSEGIGHFLNQLEPVVRDIALETDGLAIMSMSRSKGLTRRAAITMGVESGIVPSPRTSDEEEERRLLYVAMTRAKEFCYLTMATRRTDRTAFSGGATRPRATRGRSPFFSGAPIGPQDGNSYVSELRGE